MAADCSLITAAIPADIGRYSRDSQAVPRDSGRAGAVPQTNHTPWRWAAMNRRAQRKRSAEKPAARRHFLLFEKFEWSADVDNVLSP